MHARAHRWLPIVAAALEAFATVQQVFQHPRCQNKPGGNREPVPVLHEEFVARFREWAAAGGPCPEAGGPPGMA